MISALAGVLYFSEGLPYGIVTELFPVYLRINHVALAEIGLLSTVSFAWSAKVLWSPLVDAFGTYRRWISAAVASMTIVLIVMATTKPTVGVMFWTLASLLALASATQDLAVDAFTIRATPTELLGPINSIRVTAYRVALIIGGGGLTALAGRAGWRLAFGCGAVITAVVFFYTLTLPDDRGEQGHKLDLIGGVRRWLARDRAPYVLAMVFLFRLGEFAIVSMIKPYWVDRGYSPEEIGMITTVVGVIVSVAGAIAGGVFVAKFGIWHSLLWLGIAQTASNIGYALVSTMHAGRWGIYAAAVVENFGFGLGTAAFLAFMMSQCDRERAATEYAILTAAYGVTRTVMGSASGFIAQSSGYPTYFWLTVFLGIPSLLLLPFIRGTTPEMPAKGTSSA